eukprot:360203-Chlamydomonas_euryale.AAC.9
MERESVHQMGVAVDAKTGGWIEEWADGCANVRIETAPLLALPLCSIMMGTSAATQMVLRRYLPDQLWNGILNTVFRSK